MQCPRLSHDFPKCGRPSRKDQSHRYPRFRGVSPPCIPRNRGKKGARSGGGRRMSSVASLVGAYQHSGCYPRIYMPTKFLPPSVTVLTLPQHCGVFCTVRIGWVSPRHHFIPLKDIRRAFARCSTLRVLASTNCYKLGPFFGSDQCSPQRIDFGILFSLSHAYVRVSQRGTDNMHE